ncbi:TonB-dependent receptor [Sphingobium sp. LMA1-1-1.1]|uniref:TonB-dependent receptor n=1 Tax=unclassified Sphingobium TaxID=2611147 RepID=UPI003445535D
MKSSYRMASLAVLAMASMAVPVVSAQEVPAQNDAAVSAEARQNMDIIVTARRRNETTLQTPVVLTAFSAEKLADLNVTNITDVAKLTPMLIISPATGPYGGNLTLRGVASPTSNASSEPAVTINIDGVPLSYGGVVRMGNIDIGQVEVLKGPQALFFGKNSTGGIVSMRSAEPTSTFHSQLSAGYEFNAHQVDLDGYVSGPVTDTLDMRLAGRFSRQRGFFRNVAPARSIDYAPGTDEEGVRLSANWMPTDRLTVKLRATYDHVRENGSYTTSQKIACPLGAAQGPGAIAGTDDCKPNDTVVFAAIPSAAIQAVTGNPAWNSDSNFLKVRQYLISSDISYKLTDDITLNSVTGWYGIRQRVIDAQTSGARFFIGGLSSVRKNAFSQEVRLSYASPDSPIDLMMGAFYQKDNLRVLEQGVINTTAIAPLSPYWNFPLRSQSISAFGQMDWNMTDQWSLSAGVRYSRDRKYQDIVPPAGLPNKFTTPEVQFSNWSPETTLSYKPSENTNLFVSYKQGYKSGAYQIGFNTYSAALANPAITDIPAFYRPETVKGFEAGFKALMFDRQLRLNLAAYTYRYKDLQLSRLDPATIVLLILNASSARVKGLEGDLTFSPHAIPGLTLTTSAALNSAKYDSPFLSACYVGQTIAGGCTTDGPDAGTVPDQQQMLGRPLPRAPKFSGSVGASYETAVGDNLKAKFNLNGVYTSRYFLSQELNPIGFNPQRFLLDGSISVGSQSGGVEVALIGRNLTNRYYAYSGFQSPGTGRGTGTTVGVLPDFEGPISRGREIWLKITLRPGEL